MVLSFWFYSYLISVYTILFKIAIVGQNKITSVLLYFDKIQYARGRKHKGE